MSEKENANVIRELVKALEVGDVDKILTLFTDDITHVNPFGTFKGKQEVKRYLKWNAETFQDLKIYETGAGILIKEDKAFFDHKITGTADGVHCEVLAMSSYEFSNGKMAVWRAVYDRLNITEQAVQGWLPNKMVGAIVQQLRKGLD